MSTIISSLPWQWGINKYKHLHHKYYYICIYSIPYVYLSTAPGDYDSTAQTVNFPAGATTATLSVPIVDDEVLEHHETFDASLALPDGTPSQVILGRRDEAMVTILDDEIAEVHYDPDSYEWDESVGTGYLNIVSNVTSTVDYSVNTVLSNGTAYGILPNI